MNNNKRIIARISRSIKMLLFGSVVAMTVSCDDFLTIYPTDKIVYEDFWKSKEDVENMVAESYRLLSSGNVINRILIWGEARADNVIEGNYGGNKDVEYVMEANILPSNQYASWEPFYDVINNCNQVLRYAPQVLDEDPDFTQGDCNVVFGEMYALRALCHFYLVRTFRDIPLLMEAKVDDSQELYQLQVDPVVALDSCIVDLQRAEDLVLETGGYTIVSTGSNKNVGRITKDAVRAMLADVYLWKGAFLEYAAKGDDNAGAQCYEECISYCDKVLSSRMVYAEKYLKEKSGQRIEFEVHKKYPLIYMPANSIIYQSQEVSRFPYLPYTMTFGGGADGCNNPIESIFELQHDTEKDNGNREVPTFYGYPKNNDSPTEFQYGLFAAPSHLTQSLYKNIDYRKVYYLYVPGETDASDKTCIVKYSSSITGTAKDGFGTPEYKYTKTINDNGRYLSERQVNWIVYRISDVMLMKAEALVAKGGSPDEVKDILWAIYNRAQLMYMGDDGNRVGPYIDGAAYASAVLSNGDLTDVLSERQRELAYEAKRWYDVVRVSLREATVDNSAFEGMLNNKYANKGSTSQYKARLSTIDHLFFPIAEREMNIHPGLKQNIAYQTTEDIQQN